jgi:hypothetical protein
MGNFDVEGWRLIDIRFQNTNSIDLKSTADLGDRFKVTVSEHLTCLEPK